MHLRKRASPCRSSSTTSGMETRYSPPSTPMRMKISSIRWRSSGDKAAMQKQNCIDKIADYMHEKASVPTHCCQPMQRPAAVAVKMPKSELQNPSSDLIGKTRRHWRCCTWKDHHWPTAGVFRSNIRMLESTLHADTVRTLALIGWSQTSIWTRMRRPALPLGLDKPRKL
jgi:hypothetical protein